MGIRPSLSFVQFQYFFTDGRKDFRSKHLKAIGKKLGFQCELRDRPNQGGIVERIFKTINTQVLKDLPGYTGSNVQERPENAEKEACLTIQDLDKVLASFFCDDYNYQPYPKDPLIDGVPQKAIAVSSRRHSVYRLRKVNEMPQPQKS